jgi:hypothetical protein
MTLFVMVIPKIDFSLLFVMMCEGSREASVTNRCFVYGRLTSIPTLYSETPGVANMFALLKHDCEVL